MGIQGDTYAAHQDLGKIYLKTKQKKTLNFFSFKNRWFW
jgi:hypothetical protein